MTAEILIDDLPEFFVVDDHYSENVFPGYVTTMSNLRRQLIAASWTDERRAAASILMKLMSPTMPRAETLSDEHKENIAKAMRGNQNKTGKRGGNQWTRQKLKDRFTT